jgi:glycosyltransferase involved in cell wall biosynthesis
MACERELNIELILTGKISKQMDGEVQSLISSSNWNERIKYLGFLSLTDYLNVMVNSDILCMCRIDNEFSNFGFPFKLGEYLASGKAIIATAVGDVPKYIIHRKNALLISPGSVEEICEAFILLSNDVHLRSTLGNEAFNTAMNFLIINKSPN